MDIVNILVEKLTAWGESAVAALPNLALALLVFLAFWLVARFAQKALRGGLERMTGNQAVIDLLSSLTRAAILAVGLFVALGILGLQRTLTSLLAGVGVIGLALAFAFQDIAANFVSGVILAIRRPFRVGDIIESNDFYGTVEAIDLRLAEGDFGSARRQRRAGAGAAGPSRRR